MVIASGKKSYLGQSEISSITCLARLNVGVQGVHADCSC